MRTCPKCQSGNIEHHMYRGVLCVVCHDCGFDERDVLEEDYSQKKSQKAKGSYHVYKTGGHGRSRVLK